MEEKKIWAPNEDLISSLASVLDLDAAEIARRAGLLPVTLGRYINGVQEISVQALLKVCNGLRMPAHYFVRVNNISEIPTREEAIVGAAKWNAIRWNESAVIKSFGGGYGKTTWAELARVMGVTKQKPRDQWLLKKRFTLRSFLHACTELQIDPYRFLIDENRETGSIPRRRTPDAELTALREQVAQLTAAVNKLASTVNTLRESNNILARRVDALSKCDATRPTTHRSYGTSYDGIRHEHELPTAAETEP